MTFGLIRTKFKIWFGFQPHRCKHLSALLAAIIAIGRKQLGLQNSLFVSTIIKHWKGIKHVHGDFLHISDFKVLIISLFVPVGNSFLCPMLQLQEFCFDLTKL